MAKEAVGRWSDLINLSNVPVHASLLRTGKVLYWGRRRDPKSTDGASLDEHFTKSFVYDPATRTSKPTANEPTGLDKNPLNLFCAGHTFLPNGNLLVVGGHIKDGQGVNQACVYDAASSTFTPKALMNKGRWYPSALTLPDGRIIVMSGSDFDFRPNNIPQIWPSTAATPNPNSWLEVTDPILQGGPVFPLYPRVHITPKGQVFVAGPQAQSWFLTIKDSKNADIKTIINGRQTIGTWTDAKTARTGQFRDYAPSVQYDSGKVMYIGGGQDENQAPSNLIEYIDLNEANPKWTNSAATNMKFPRRQFNATVLPDGSVLVTGGSKGPGFNNLVDTVHQAELFNPVTKKWTEMAAEKVNRCYHSISLLLPDGRVLSGGGGEYGGAGPDQCFPNAQIFEPPYLFKGARPTITKAPSDISYGKEFQITIGSSDPIDKVSWVRLGSVTHTRNMNQSLIFLKGHKQNGTTLTIPAPANGNIAPPGHYMLFVLNKQGVPSEARIIGIAQPAPARVAAFGLSHSSDEVEETAEAAPSSSSTCCQPTLHDHNERIMAEQGRPPVVVGLTPSCPYGLGACWGGAYEALKGIADIDVVCPLAHQNDALAFVYLKNDIIPDIDVWRQEFAKTANRSYDMRGIELTLSGTVAKSGEKLTLAGTATRAQLTLAPFQKGSQIKYDTAGEVARAVSEADAGAYKQLAATVGSYPAGVSVQVTGTLQKGAGGHSLEVREFKVLDGGAVLN